MAKVKGPDGKIYNFPEGTTQEQAIAFFKKRAEASPTGMSFSDVAPPAENVTDNRPAVELQDVLRSLGQGITFGWGDEVTSGIAASLAKMLDNAEYRQAYEDIVKAQRTEGKEFAQNYPGLDLGLQIGSGLLTGKAPLQAVRGIGNQAAKIVPQASKNLASQVPNATRLAKSAAESASLGAVAGAGYDDESAVGGALEGAVVGGTLGAAIPTLFSATRKAGQISRSAADVLANSLGIGSGDSVARRRLLQAIERDRTTPEKLLEQLHIAESQGYPVSLIDLAGPNVTNIAQRVVKRSGPEYQKILERHQGRLQDVPERAREAASADLVMSNAENRTFHDWNKYLDNQIDSVTDNLTYSIATRQGRMPQIVKEKFYDLIKGDDDFRKAIAKGKEIVATRKDINLKNPDNEFGLLYYTKKGLDSMLDTKKKPHYDPEVSDRLRSKSDAIDGLLREMSGDYSTQADFLKDLQRQKGVLEIGAKIQDPKFTPDALRGELGMLKKDDLPLLLSGVREASLNNFGKNIGKMPMEELIFGKPVSSLREKMDQVYAFDPESYKLMVDRVKAYDNMVKTSREIPSLATTNPLSAVIDPESRDITLAMGSSGLAGLLNLPWMSVPLAAYAASRLVPASAAQKISKGVYGPISETEELLRPMVPGPLRQFMNKAERGVAKAVPAPYAYGVLPQVFGQEPMIEEENFE